MTNRTPQEILASLDQTVGPMVDPTPEELVASLDQIIEAMISILTMTDLPDHLMRKAFRIGAEAKAERRQWERLGY